MTRGSSALTIVRSAGTAPMYLRRCLANNVPRTGVAPSGLNMVMTSRLVRFDGHTISSGCCIWNLMPRDRRNAEIDCSAISMVCLSPGGNRFRPRRVLPRMVQMKPGFHDLPDHPSKAALGAGENAAGEQPDIHGDHPAVYRSCIHESPIYLRQVTGVAAGVRHGGRRAPWRAWRVLGA